MLELNDGKQVPPHGEELASSASTIIVSEGTILTTEHSLLAFVRQAEAVSKPKWFQ